MPFDDDVTPPPIDLSRPRIRGNPMKRPAKKAQEAGAAKPEAKKPPTKFEIVSVVLTHETKPYGRAVIGGTNYLLEDNAQGVMVFPRHHPEQPDLIPWANVKVANLRAARGAK